jgi:hypothetical protein
MTKTLAMEGDPERLVHNFDANRGGEVAMAGFD